MEPTEEVSVALALVVRKQLRALLLGRKRHDFLEYARPEVLEVVAIFDLGPTQVLKVTDVQQGQGQVLDAQIVGESRFRS